MKPKIFFWQLSHAIKWMHDKGIVHRDIKPENILMVRYANPNGSKSIWWPKLADFGYSCYADNSRNRNDQNIVHCGSLGYAAPELYEDKPIKNLKALDVYSLGATINAVVNGNKHSGTQELPIPYFGISSAMRELLLGMTEKDPMKRFTMEQVMKHRWFQEEAKAVMLHNWIASFFFIIISGNSKAIKS